MPPKIAAAWPRSAVKPLLFLASVVLAGEISWFTYGNSSAGFMLFCFPLVCTFSIFAVLTLVLRKNNILGTLLPLLVLPLLFILLFGYMVYERNPQNMFRIFVADPIPAGVTNIQGRIQDEFDDVVITFQASPEAVDAIIARNDFELKNLDDYPDEDLPEYSWKGNWTRYVTLFHSGGGNLIGYMNMWVDTEQSIVIIRRRGW